MTKIFYSVRHYYLGKDHPVDEWFDNREEAIEFSRMDLSDGVVRHTFRNEKSIKTAEHYVQVNHTNEIGEELNLI